MVQKGYQCIDTHISTLNEKMLISNKWRNFYPKRRVPQQLEKDGSQTRDEQKGLRVEIYYTNLSSKIIQLLIFQFIHSVLQNPGANF